MSKKTKKQIYLAAMAVLFVCTMAIMASWTIQGCAGKIPPIAVMVPTATATP